MRLTFEEREKLFELAWIKCKEIMNKKGPGYTKEGLANANFWEGAEDYGLSPMQVLAIHMSKHTNSIKTYIKKNGVDIIDPESIQERIFDHVNYLMILWSILLEMDKMPNPLGKK